MDVLLFSNLLVLVELRIGFPLLLDDQEEDTGGDAEDDGEHGDHGGEDDVVQHGGGGPAVARHRHLGHHWGGEKVRDNSDNLSDWPDLSLSWPHTQAEACHTGGRYK